MTIEDETETLNNEELEPTPYENQYRNTLGDDDDDGDIEDPVDMATPQPRQKQGMIDKNNESQDTHDYKKRYGDLKKHYDNKLNEWKQQQELLEAQLSMAEKSSELPVLPKTEEELTEGQYRLLETDTRVVVPVDTTIRLLVTGGDVIHAWAIPAFGVKIDGIPGRINETWFRATKEGVFYGQCSELCGAYHSFMPIAVEVVSKQAYREWVEFARDEYDESMLEKPANLAIADYR